MEAFSNNKLINYLINKQIRLFKIFVSSIPYTWIYFECPRIHNRIQKYKSKHGISVKNIPFNLKGEKKNATTHFPHEKHFSPLMRTQHPLNSVPYFTMTKWKPNAEHKNHFSREKKTNVKLINCGPILKFVMDLTMERQVIVLS